MILLEFAVGLLEARRKVGKLWNLVTGKPYPHRGVYIEEDNEGYFAIVPVGCDVGVARNMVVTVANMEIAPEGVADGK